MNVKDLRVKIIKTLPYAELTRSSTHHFNTPNTPLQHPKSVSATPKTLQFNTLLSSTPKTLQVCWPEVCVELKGFWYWTDCCVELRLFCVELTDFGGWKGVALLCWTEGVWNWGDLWTRGWLSGQAARSPGIFGIGPEVTECPSLVHHVQIKLKPFKR